MLPFSRSVCSKPFSFLLKSNVYCFFFLKKDYWKRTISPCLDFLRHEKRVLGLMTGQRGIGKTEYVKDKISSTRHAYISLTNLGSQQKLRGELFTKIENPPPLIIDDAHILLQWSEKWVFHVLESAESDRNILLVGSEPMSRRLIQLSNWFAKPLLILPTPFISPSLLASQIPHSVFIFFFLFFLFLLIFCFSSVLFDTQYISFISFNRFLKNVEQTYQIFGLCIQKCFYLQKME